jgi:co-chaperonin GroES (HSP10)
MQQRLLKTQLAEYVPILWDGNNRSGWAPVNEKVLVLPDKASDRIGSILVDDTTKDRHELAAESGIIIAMGDTAFKWTTDRVRPWEGDKPKVGDRIAMERYAGQLVTGDDGEVYRLMEDRCIGAIRLTARKDAKKGDKK